MTNIAFLIFVGVAFALVFLLRKMRIGTLLAFWVVGILVGPHGVGLFELNSVWGLLGEIGIIFLWFSIGLELNTKRLWQMRRNIFGFGAAQVLMVAVMLFPILFGLTPWSLAGVIMVALLLSMSSMPSDLQILADRNELQTNLGRQTFSILLFQDLLSIPLLAMLPVFVGKSFNFGAEIIDVSVMTVGLVLGVVVVGRFILNPLMRQVARLKSKEASLLAVMLTIIVWVVVFELIGLPSAMGAFLAGMLLSETVYRKQVQVDVAPYQVLFLSFFFIVLGMGLNLPYLAENWWIVALGVMGLIGVKFMAIFTVARVRGVLNREAFLIALILAQGGEFGLLILQTMKTTGIPAIPFPHIEILLAIIAVSMMVTPLLLVVYDKLYESGKLYSGARAKKLNADMPEIKPEVVICGFGRVGRTIAKMLTAERIPYIAIDMNADEVVMGREAGYNVIYGDTASDAILRSAGLSKRKTRAVIIALDNAAIAKKTVRAIKRVQPTAKIYARARDLTEANVLLAEGVRMALPETIESSFLLGREVLSNLGVENREVDLLMARLRGDNYTTLSEILNRN
jgi:glutathione-regulated potassium-efflux system ancillary protein KefC